MPNGSVTFPCSEAKQGAALRRIGRQSAILAKTLFTNRFPSLPSIGQAQGIRVGGRGFQMIKEALRESTGIEVSKGPSNRLVRRTISIFYGMDVDRSSYRSGDLGSPNIRPIGSGDGR
jgi:hypothetical protein